MKNEIPTQMFGDVLVMAAICNDGVSHDEPVTNRQTPGWKLKKVFLIIHHT